MAGRYDFSIKAADEMEADGLTPRDVAESIGMGRNKLLGVKNVIGIIFNADGTMQ